MKRVRAVISASGLLTGHGLGPKEKDCVLMRKVLFIVVVTVAVVSGRAAEATPLLVSNLGDLLNPGVSASSATGPLTNSYTATARTAESTASYGQLGILASFATEFGTNGGLVGGHTDWRDDFTITGPTSGPTDFALHFLLDGALNVDPATGSVNLHNGYQTASIAARLTGLPGGVACNGGVAMGLLGSTPSCNWSYAETVSRFYDAGSPSSASYTDTTTTAGSRDVSFVVSLNVGDTYSLSQSLAAYIYNDELKAGSHTDVDFLNTALFTMTALDSRYGYTTASGTDYSALADVDPTPVPEPASLLLVGCGLLAGVRRARRFRSVP